MICITSILFRFSLTFFGRRWIIFDGCIIKKEKPLKGTQQDATIQLSITISNRWQIRIYLALKTCWVRFVPVQVPGPTKTFVFVKMHPFLDYWKYSKWIEKYLVMPEVKMFDCRANVGHFHIFIISGWWWKGLLKFYLPDNSKNIEQARIKLMNTSASNHCPHSNG